MANDELIVAQEQMLLLGRKTPSEKLASFLVRLSRNNQKWQRPASPIHLSMTREDISDYLGLTIETVSRTFTKLKNQGIIALPERNHVTLVDMEKLEVLAETY
jgi:CRP/FNR family transcriptional regulator